ncbi:MAG: DUF1405 domain-containing protein [Candidatus Micrarchaeota archaeon]|nr:DUF1405 domain-containing protein [Candidatus Micrarchaeota archaeon]
MRKENLLFWLLLLFCGFAIFKGAVYYAYQLSLTPPALLLFVPDCPLYVLLALPLILRLVRSESYSFFVSAGMVKYGIWTIFVLLFYQEYWEPSQLQTTLLFIAGHICMALLGAALAPPKRVAFAVVAAVVLWFLLNDYADYWLGTRPLIPDREIGLVRNLTVASSILFPLALYWYGENLRSAAPVAFFRRIIQN